MAAAAPRPRAPLHPSPDRRLPARHGRRRRAARAAVAAAQKEAAAANKGKPLQDVYAAEMAVVPELAALGKLWKSTVVDAADKGGEGLWAGSSLGLVAGFQTLTGSRATWVGGVELFSDEYAQKPAPK